MTEIAVPFKNKPKLAIALTAGFSLALLLLPQPVRLSFSATLSNIIYAPFFSIGKVLSELLAVRQANQSLKNQLLQLSLENQALKETARENERLRGLLGLPAPPGFLPVAAELVGVESTHQPTELTVNRGTADGIRRNLPVVHLKGLVGKVVDATRNAAVIQMLFDPGCRVAARSQRSRVLGIVKWKSGPYLSLENVSPADDVAPGDTIVSSGLGGIFPEGLVVGTVRSVSSDTTSIFRKIELAPAVVFSALDEVFILVPHKASEGERK
ncbi:MAG: rod shape-determining protein MreC [candidate division Zixibacteria bacterium]|nr:rod shape-determining protein MreC [candidate division Zixibacteria bacterium]